MQIKKIRAATSRSVSRKSEIGLRLDKRLGIFKIDEANATVILE